jgi:hypothetical protein
VEGNLEAHEDEEMGADDAEIAMQEVICHAKKTGKTR